MSNDSSSTDFEDLFQNYMSDVKPLSTDKVLHPKQTPSSKIKSKNKNTNLELRKRNHLMHEDTFFSFKLSKELQTKLIKGAFTIDASLDLHGYLEPEVERLIKQFINDCIEQKIKYAIIVHGQGKHSQSGSILKPAVLYCLSKWVVISAYCAAQPKDGGLGATYIFIQGDS